MRNRFIVYALVLCGCVAAAQNKPVTLRAGTLLDGKGGVQHNVRITVQDGKIQSVAADKGGAADYDLSADTVMPGWIDTHVHITWHFGPDGRVRFADEGVKNNSESAEQAALAYASNAWKTLEAGVT